MPFGLSKSRLIEWRQCPKRLWLKVNRPELAETSPAAERAFRVGYEIGEIARSLYPDGVLVETRDLREALTITRELLHTEPGRPIFEATFERDGLLVQADLLLPENGGYRMVEVKSATSVKDYYIEDAAIQRWTASGTITLTGLDIAHVNNHFVYPGNLEYQGLLTHAPVLEETEPYVPQLPDWILAARATLSGSKPDIDPGPQCSTPFECPFVAHCTKDAPQTAYPLSILPRLSTAKREQLEARGIIDVRDVPDDFELSSQQARILRITKSGLHELLPKAGKELASLAWPRHYLDFETVGMPVPVWVGTRPYQSLPVQWSCHIEHEDGRMEHHVFLAEGSDDPREAFARSLLEALGKAGAILVYNRAFEVGRIEELARDIPVLSPALMALPDRVFDLLPLTRECYYHPDMRGSWSIKAVLPTIGCGLDYTGMAIGDGGAAESAWQEVLHPDTPADRRHALREALTEYCALDTLAMVRLAHFLAA